MHLTDAFTQFASTTKPNEGQSPKGTSKGTRIPLGTALVLSCLRVSQCVTVLSSTSHQQARHSLHQNCTFLPSALRTPAHTPTPS